MSNPFATDAMLIAAKARVGGAVSAILGLGLGMSTTTITTSSSPRVGID